ncbi:MAG TPA: hypothetical protein VF691_17580, partial [Cytophagaceae bacterium]
MKKKLSRFIATAALAIAYFASSAQTGYFQDFSAGTLPAGFESTTPFTITVANQEMKAAVNKGNFYDGLTISFPTAINLSANPTLTFKIKVDLQTMPTDFRVTAFLFNAGGTNQTGIVGTVSPKIRASDVYQTISMRFNNTPINLAAVTSMQ